ncbi:MAG TPA: PfkB family carbohydrate kinase [Streptosporangiaceae bacterium]|nr:PfkB family carbohydrate kinase [Streptosporangiaceae bacterium]
MILVAGESLIDLIVGPRGDVHASPGGGPFNTARTIARLGQPVRFLGRFSADPFGALLAGKLADDQVGLALPEQVPQPTALAIVSLNEAGVARYWFHLTGTAGFVLDQPSAERALRADVTALHIGTLGLVVEPMAGVVEGLAGQRPSSVLLMLDPNWRASAIPDPSAHLARIRRLLVRTDILKTSMEDLPFLVPGDDVPAAARTLLGWGARCVLVTDGPAPVRAFTADGQQLTVPTPPAQVVDTVGAGDAFGGGFLAWWAERGLDRDQLADPGLLAAAVAAGARVAALTCTRAGAEPPWQQEIRAAEHPGGQPAPGPGTARS